MGGESFTGTTQAALRYGIGMARRCGTATIPAASHSSMSKVMFRFPSSSTWQSACLLTVNSTLNTIVTNGQRLSAYEDATVARLRPQHGVAVLAVVEHHAAAPR